MSLYLLLDLFFFSSRRRHTRLQGDWSSDVCSSDLDVGPSRFALKLVLGNADIQTLVGDAEKDIKGQLSASLDLERSEERRVGKECRSRWAAWPYKKEERLR